ncbi:MAG TPA: hypothetical protein VIY48_11415 [Candidatus Paceibacterota bacterium]
MTRKLYGWEENGKFILSLFKRIGGKPQNVYDSQAKAVEEAAQRGMQIEWLQ